MQRGRAACRGQRVIQTSRHFLFRRGLFGLLFSSVQPFGSGLAPVSFAILVATKEDGFSPARAHLCVLSESMTEDAAPRSLMPSRDGPGFRVLASCRGMRGAPTKGISWMGLARPYAGVVLEFSHRVIVRATAGHLE